MNDPTYIQISSPCGDIEEIWLKELWQSEWGGDIMVSRGHVYRFSDLKSLVARLGDDLIGAATYRLDDKAGCELMSINATNQGGGIGTKLLATIEAEAQAAGCRRVWLITSNDNLDALRFYQRRGYRLAAVYSGAIDEARRVKPTIPLVGEYGIWIHDELELSKNLGSNHFSMARKED